MGAKYHEMEEQEERMKRVGEKRKRERQTEHKTREDMSNTENMFQQDGVM